MIDADPSASRPPTGRHAAVPGSPLIEAQRDAAFIRYLQEMAPRLQEGRSAADVDAWEAVMRHGFELGLDKEDILEIAAEVLQGNPAERAKRRCCPACGEAILVDVIPEHCPRCLLRLPRCPSCRTVNHPLSATHCSNPRCPGKGAPLVSIESWDTFRGDAARTGRACRLAEAWLDPVANAPRLEWSLEFGESVVASPVVGAGLVFVAGKDGLVAAFDRAGRSFSTGDPGWPLRLSGTIAATPLYHRGMLYVATLAGEVLALDALKGRQIAAAMDLGPIDASPAMDPLGGTLVVATHQGTLVGLDRGTLSMRWHFPSPGDRPPGAPFHASPALADGVVVAVTEAGEIVALDVSATHARERWRAWAPGEVLATPVILKGFVCVLSKSGELATYRLGDGRLHARGVSPGASFVVGSPALAALNLEASQPTGPGGLVFGGADGRVHAFDYLVAQVPGGYPVDPGFPVPGPFLASPAVAGRLAIMADDSGHMIGLDTVARRMAWTLALTGPVRSSPALDGDRLYVCTETGTLCAFSIIAAGS